MKRSLDMAKGLRALVVVGSGVLAALPVCAGPTVSVPSTPDISGKVNIRGTNLAAYSNVTVRFVNGNLSPIDLVTQVSADGSFKVKFAPPVKGAYQVLVFDSNGQQIGQGTFGHIR